MDSTEEELATQVEGLALQGDGEQLESVLSALSTTETARMLADVTRECRTSILTLLEPKEAARLMESVCETQAVGMISDLSPHEAAAVISEIESDLQVDILGQLSAEQAGQIISEMEATQAEDVRTRIEYDPETAGGLMVTEFLQHPVDATVGEVIQFLRAHEDQLSDYSVQYVFVVEADGALIGVLRLRDLVLVGPERSVASIMINDPESVPVSTPLSELEDIFDRLRFLGIPVVDEQQRIVGVVRRSDVQEAIGHRSDSDYLKSSGILGGEELRTMPVTLRSRRRLSWLTINIGLNLVAASVIAMYQDTLQAVIALAVFLPIISDMSGCSGSQAVAVSVRELALGLVNAKDMLRVWTKEVLVGIINGGILGLLIAIVAWVWKGNVVLGAVVGVALAINTVVAVSIGGVIPLLLTKFNKDPALASGPILTTITDMCGFFAVLSLASLCLPWLV